MPSSLSGILSVAKTGLLSHQLAMQVASHNLANATTEGYTRQRADLVPGTPVLLPEGLLGTGVRVADISRVRDRLLDSVYRRENALFHSLTAQYNGLSVIEGELGEPGQFSLGATIDGFFNSWSELSSDPSSTTARVAVVSSATALVDQFHRINSALGSLASETVDRMQAGITEANRLLSEIADVNRDISQVSATGNSAPDLEDRRDLLIDRLSEYIRVDVQARDTGGVGVTSNGISLVEGISYTRLSAQNLAGTWTVQTAGGLTVDPDAGRIGGSIDLLNTQLSGFSADLDELARGIVERVNAAHATGTNPLGGTGINFFDDFGNPALVNASNFALDAAILADSQAIAAGTPDGGGNYRPGANDVALAIAGLRTTGGGAFLGGRSIEDAYRDLASDVSTAVASAGQSRDTHGVLVAGARDRRESVAGVATDEELIKVVQIQAAYTAASRIITVVDEMYQTLLSV